jgi:hypothetical protein
LHDPSVDARRLPVQSTNKNPEGRSRLAELGYKSDHVFPDCRLALRRGFGRAGQDLGVVAHQITVHAMTAILSLEDDDGLRCVDIIQAGSGTFTFKEFRKDVEDPGRWYLVRDYSDKSFNSKDDAIAAAAASTSWLREKLDRGNRRGG